MKIHAYILCYNESEIIRFTIEHYSSFCSKIFILDNNSTDNSVDIALEYSNVKVVTWDSGNQLNDLINIQTKIENYKRFSRDSSDECIESADWIITADMDELLYHRDIIGVLNKYENEHATVAKIIGFNMVSPKNPSIGTPIIEQIRTGFRHDAFDKPILFKSSFDMEFSVGCHPGGSGFERMKNQRNFKFGTETIALLHYKHIGNRYFEKSRESAKRLSSVNLSHKWGSHYLIGEEGFSKRTEHVRNIARTVIDEHGNIILTSE